MVLVLRLLLFSRLHPWPLRHILNCCVCHDRNKTLFKDVDGCWENRNLAPQLEMKYQKSVTLEQAREQA